MNDLIIDIREKEEYFAEHIKGSINLPLSDNEKNIINLIEYNAHKNPQTKSILMCKSGKRSELLFNSLPEEIKKNVSIFEGGIDKYDQDSKQSNTVKTNLSIFRQVMVTIGAILLSTALISILLGNGFGLLTFIQTGIGIGTLYAGLSGNCLMMNILQKMPWNKKNN